LQKNKVSNIAFQIVNYKNMLKKIIICSLILFVSVGGFAKKPNNSTALLPKLPKTILYSDGFKLFWKKLAEESQGLKTLSDYIPSNSMKEIFIFVETAQKQQGVQGYLQVIPEFFDGWTFEDLGGVLILFQDGIYQFTMPIESLVPMLDIQGIVQIDIPRKIKK